MNAWTWRVMDDSISHTMHVQLIPASINDYASGTRVEIITLLPFFILTSSLLLVGFVFGFRVTFQLWLC